MDNNIKKLLISALGPVSAAASFSRSLVLRLKDALAGLTAGQKQPAQKDQACEENLARLMASTVSPARSNPEFTDRLLRQLISASNEVKQKSRVPVLVPTLVAAAIIILLFGFLIYPFYLSGGGSKVIANVNQGKGVAVLAKPLFFIWGTRTATSNLYTGETISLAKNDRISSGPDSMVTLTLPNESSLKLYPESNLVISDLDDIGKSGTPVVRVKLDSGKATSEINNLAYELDTPSVAATVPGTAFRVEVISTDHTYLATSEGVVHLTMDGDTVEVAAGEEVNAIKGHPLTVNAERPPMLIIESPERPEVSSDTVVMKGKTDIDATVTVDNNPVPVDLNGSFEVTLTLTPGANPVSITATSPTGKTTTLNFILIRK